MKQANRDIRGQADWGRVAHLTPRDGAEFDQDRLTELAVDLGEAGARRGLTATLGRIAERLDLVEVLILRRDKLSAIAQCRDIARMAARMGLVSLTRAADGVAGALATGDRTALAATRARLHRQVTLAAQAQTDLADAHP